MPTTRSAPRRSISNAQKPSQVPTSRQVFPSNESGRPCRSTQERRSNRPVDRKPSPSSIVWYQAASRGSSMLEGPFFGLRHANRVRARRRAPDPRPARRESSQRMRPARARSRSHRAPPPAATRAARTWRPSLPEAPSALDAAPSQPARARHEALATRRRSAPPRSAARRSSSCLALK